MATIQTVLWRAILLAGHEYCRLVSQEAQWQLNGIAVFTHERLPCRLDYTVTCDAAWRTLSANVKGWLGDTRVSTNLTTGADQRWYINGVEQPQVFGCIDLDLNFSPSTNLLPIRRLGLPIGARAEITAAWLKFPGFTLEPLPQQYTRVEENVYRYESGGDRFVAHLRVNPTGFVLDYPGIWLAEAASGSE
ncbi:MAG TPA: putative glycolipid-binding domain-containing protein [Anaerolineales bacterium]